MSYNSYNVPEELHANPAMLKRLDELPLKTGTFNSLRNYLGIVYVAQIFEYSIPKLLEVPSLGRGSLRDLQETLSQCCGISQSMLEGLYTPIEPEITKFLIGDESVPVIKPDMKSLPVGFFRKIKEIDAQGHKNTRERIRFVFQIGGPQANRTPTIQPLTLQSVGVTADRITGEFNVPPMISAAIQEGIIDESELGAAFEKAIAALAPDVTVELEDSIAAALARS